jgi:heat shock protein HtpX
MTLYTQVSSNRLKTGVFLIVYLALIMVIGYVLYLYFGMVDILLIAGVIAVVQGLVGLYMSDRIALAAARAKPMDEIQYRWVHQMTENLAITAGLPKPRLFLIQDSSINAFATGRNPKNGAIAFTTGALERLNKQEVEGVMAHEMAHIGNEDIRLMSLVLVLAGVIAITSDIFLRSMFLGRGGNDNNRGGGGAVLMLLALLLIVLAPLAATLIQLAISRKREYMADATAVLLTRYPEGLISALRTIGGDKEQLEVASRGTAHMYFSNPLKGKSFSKLFSTHPPIEERIRALEKGSGITSG